MLAAHGDGDESESNHWALELAARAGALGGFSRAVVGFQKVRRPSRRLWEPFLPGMWSLFR